MCAYPPKGSATSEMWRTFTIPELVPLSGTGPSTRPPPRKIIGCWVESLS